MPVCVCLLSNFTVCLFVCFFYFFWTGFSIRKSLLIHTFFLKQGFRHIVCVHVHVHLHAIFSYLYCTSVTKHRGWADRKNAHRINLQIWTRFYNSRKTGKKVNWTNLYVPEWFFLRIASICKINTLSTLGLCRVKSWFR